MLFPALADRAWYDYHDTQTATIEVLPMFEGAMNTEMMIFFLTMVYYYYGSFRMFRTEKSGVAAFKRFRCMVHSDTVSKSQQIKIAEN